jgi:hypothetical protein
MAPARTNSAATGPISLTQNRAHHQERRTPAQPAPEVVGPKPHQGVSHGVHHPAKHLDGAEHRRQEQRPGALHIEW